MPFRIRKSIDIDFSHHVRSHDGACINLHGHTWKFEVELGADELDALGFVIDFARIKQDLLVPCHQLLDHALAVGADTWADLEPQLEETGRRLLATRSTPAPPEPNLAPLCGAVPRRPGGMKVAVFPFSPTSERLAAWLWQAATERCGDERVRVEVARIFETLHPVEAVAEYRPAP